MDLAQLPKETWQEITDLLMKRRKIEAIKIYREQAGVGLKEAKEAVETFQEELAQQFPDRFPKGGVGCSAAFLILLGTGVIWAIA